MSISPLFVGLFEQLAVYGLVRWILFVGIAFGLARYFGGVGIICGHFLIAFLIAVHDIHWIESAMRAPGWEGAPDMDIIFWVGLAFRVILVNTLLLPISIISYRYWLRDDTDPGTLVT